MFGISRTFFHISAGLVFGVLQIRKFSPFPLNSQFGPDFRKVLRFPLRDPSKPFHNQSIYPLVFDFYRYCKSSQYPWMRFRYSWYWLSSKAFGLPKTSPTTNHLKPPLKCLERGKVPFFGYVMSARTKVELPSRSSTKSIPPATSVNMPRATSAVTFVLRDRQDLLLDSS